MVTKIPQQMCLFSTSQHFEKTILDKIIPLWLENVKRNITQAVFHFAFVFEKHVPFLRKLCFEEFMEFTQRELFLVLLLSGLFLYRQPFDDVKRPLGIKGFQLKQK